MWYLLCLIPLLILIPFSGRLHLSAGHQPVGYHRLPLSQPALYPTKPSGRARVSPLWSNTILVRISLHCGPTFRFALPSRLAGSVVPDVAAWHRPDTALHLVFGAFGMYLFLKSEGVRSQPASRCHLRAGFCTAAESDRSLCCRSSVVALCHQLDALAASCSLSLEGGSPVDRYSGVRQVSCWA